MRTKAEPSHAPPILRWIVPLILLLSAAMIVAGARGDLWLDEIWSLSFARSARTWTDVFTRFHHDNNHVLNTLYLCCVRDSIDPLALRGLAIVSGIGSVALIGIAARRWWGRGEAIVSMLLAGTSYPMVLYASEARGYAPATCLGLAAFVVIGRDPQSCSGLRRAAFWILSALGILAHATFVVLTVALALWHLAVEIARRAGFQPAAERLVATHAPPLLFFLAWYLYFLRLMEVGGGPEYGTWTVVGQLSAYVLGIPDAAGFRAGAVLIALIVIAAGVVSFRRHRESGASFFQILLVLSPALLLLLSRPKYLYFRYLMMLVPFFLMVTSYLLCTGLRSSSPSLRAFAAAAVAILVAAQGPRITRLLTDGRGRYSAALERIAQASSGPNVLVGSDHDFRNRMVFDYFTPRIAGGERLHYVEQARWKVEIPDWIVTHSQDLSVRPAAHWCPLPGVEYRLDGEYPFSGVSGWSWFLFRRAGDG